MEKTLYKIRNIECKYQQGQHSVLNVEQLDIIEGTVVFIVGASGVGKSTILEALGLMNNTSIPNKKSEFVLSAKKEDVNIFDLWDKKEKVIAEFRKDNLSFIFQNTNLFSTLTVMENIILPALLKGKSKKDSIDQAKTILSEIASDEMDGSESITKISGGQRQRVAFARAIIADNLILFADEPTGNLDMNNASLLMESLVKQIKTRKQTAVIVTHDIKIALEQADKIVLIEKVKHTNNNNKNDELSYGKVSHEYTFERNGTIWNNLTDINQKKYTKDELANLLKEKI